MSTQHQEFPELCKQAQAAHQAGRLAVLPSGGLPLTADDRRYLSAFLLEVISQAEEGCVWTWHTIGGRLEAIAHNLHSPPPPPPPPPTRDQMEQALQSLIDEYGARVAGEWTDAHLQTLSAGIAHYCKVQP